jgi:hypothetical protein
LCDRPLTPPTKAEIFHQSGRRKAIALVDLVVAQNKCRRTIAGSAALRCFDQAKME